MFFLDPCHWRRRHTKIAGAALWPVTLLAISCGGLRAANAQTISPADNPASIPAGATPPLPANHQAASNAHAMSPKQARAADDAYLEGAKHVQHQELADAVGCFQQAVRLNPNNSDYSLALTHLNSLHKILLRRFKGRLN
jgi:general secretion pathway protein D